MGIIQLKIKKSIFNEAYLPSLEDYTARYRIYYGGGGSGKSHFIVQRFILKASTARRKILCLRKVGSTLKNSVFQLLIDQLKFFGLYSLCKINVSNFTVELPNGSSFICVGLDNPEKIKSIAGITDIWLEEATDFTQEDFNQLDLRLRHPTAPNQEIVLSFNPISKQNWCYKLFFAEDPSLEGFRAKCAIQKTTYLDNHFLPQSYIDSIQGLKLTNPTYYRIYALGEFCSLDKLIYPYFQIAESPPRETDWKLLIGLDFGYINDPSALIVSYLDQRNSTIYIVDEIYKRGLLNNEIATLIKTKGLAKELIIADSAEQKSIEEIKRAGVARIRAAKKGQGSILQGIQKLQQFKLIVSPKCEFTIAELQNYSWRKDKKTGEYINEPIDEWNHALDALRYSLQCAEIPQKLKSFSKASLGL